MRVHNFAARRLPSTSWIGTPCAPPLWCQHTFSFMFSPFSTLAFNEVRHLLHGTFDAHSISSLAEEGIIPLFVSLHCGNNGWNIISPGLDQATWTPPPPPHSSSFVSLGSQVLAAEVMLSMPLAFLVR